MENRAVFIRRILYLAALAASLVFVSFYGGNVPYMLCILLLGNIAVSYGYIYYVFYSIRIFQRIPEHGVKKGEEIELDFSIANESKIPFSSVRLNFLEGLSEVYGKEQFYHIGLNIGEKQCAKLRFVCNYSGMYHAGVDTIEIMDYFGIFRMKFEMPQKMKVYVTPRILEVEKLPFLTSSEETINSSNIKMAETVLDNETRFYEPSDAKNLIHWKNTAKRNRLMVRTYSSEETNHYSVVMDGYIETEDSYERIVIQDKLRETFLAIAGYLFDKGYQLECCMDREDAVPIRSSYEWKLLYDRVAESNFNQEFALSQLCANLAAGREENTTIIFVSCREKPDEVRNLNLQCFWLDVSVCQHVEELL